MVLAGRLRVLAAVVLAVGVVLTAAGRAGATFDGLGWWRRPGVGESEGRALAGTTGRIRGLYEPEFCLRWRSAGYGGSVRGVEAAGGDGNEAWL
ncbi:uncharacterized protein THITE_2113460 [Thermothielavioides terrestris NRRL 8126]|uniref:Uncharacterized protein n=1 Tax=Thermothielavioides terrestris (strain ATCC 38088 / NRRL 8126) TaxID=578455 RepID=G2R2W6_THETT|nr:uncharacterized protein THITE_2113460 [Thermothielavioides terrestris NRRL 8126]AEO65882.1 hypothetical protein THITE_2113460 [Thermothielavioides terrestris NRRL 8126]